MKYEMRLPAEEGQVSMVMEGGGERTTLETGKASTALRDMGEGYLRASGHF